MSRSSRGGEGSFERWITPRMQQRDRDRVGGVSRHGIVDSVEHVGKVVGGDVAIDLDDGMWMESSRFDVSGEEIGSLLVADQDEVTEAGGRHEDGRCESSLQERVGRPGRRESEVDGREGRADRRPRDQVQR